MSRPVQRALGRHASGREQAIDATCGEGSESMRRRGVRHDGMAALAPGGRRAVAAQAPAGSTAPELLFPVEHWHNHSSSIVEHPDGHLLVTWFHGSGERTADDVELLGAWQREGTTTWTAPAASPTRPAIPTPIPRCSSTARHALAAVADHPRQRVAHRADEGEDDADVAGRRGAARGTPARSCTSRPVIASPRSRAARPIASPAAALPER